MNFFFDNENQFLLENNENFLIPDNAFDTLNPPYSLNSNILENLNSLDSYSENDRNSEYMFILDKNNSKENETTNQNSNLLKRKTKREDEVKDNKNINPEEENNSKNKSNNKENINNNKEVKIIEIKNKVYFRAEHIEGNGIENLNNKKSYKYGRKTQEEKNNGINGNHTRYSEDNIIRKIKSFFGKSLFKFINQNLQNSNFIKLEIAVNKELKKDYNLKLFNMTLKEIYSKSNISNKYKHEKRNKNEKLIKEIYSKSKETSVIKILNLTYLEAFDIFRRNIKENNYISPCLQKKIEGTDILDNKKFEDVISLIDKIKKEEKNKNGDIEQYINYVKNLCLNFENWFEKKVGRDR